MDVTLIRQYLQEFADKTADAEIDPAAAQSFVEERAGQKISAADFQQAMESFERMPQHTGDPLGQQSPRPVTAGLDPPDFSHAMLLVVDAQRGFGKETENPALKGLKDSETNELNNMADLIDTVFDGGGRVVVTKDWHTKDGREKEEFKIYGEHCVPGSGEENLNAPVRAAVDQAEQQLRAQGESGRRVIGVDENDATAAPGSDRLVEVHKNMYDVTQRMVYDDEGEIVQQAHAEFVEMVQQAQDQGVDTIIIAGKIAEVCVNAAAASLHELFPEMHIILANDAISSLAASDDVVHGLGLKTKEEVLENLTVSERVNRMGTAALVHSVPEIQASIAGA